MEKNQFVSSVLSSDTVNFGVLSPDWPTPVLTRLTPKIFNHLLICMNLYQHAKNQLISSVYSWDIVYFRVQRQDCHQCFDHAQPKTLDFCEFVKYTKNEAVSSICSEEIVDWKIQQPSCLWAFWLIS